MNETSLVENGQGVPVGAGVPASRAANLTTGGTATQKTRSSKNLGAHKEPPTVTPERKNGRKGKKSAPNYRK